MRTRIHANLVLPNLIYLARCPVPGHGSTLSAREYPSLLVPGINKRQAHCAIGPQGPRQNYGPIVGEVAAALNDHWLNDGLPSLCSSELSRNEFGCFVELH